MERSVCALRGGAYALGIASLMLLAACEDEGLSSLGEGESDTKTATDTQVVSETGVVTSTLTVTNATTGTITQTSTSTNTGTAPVIATSTSVSTSTKTETMTAVTSTSVATATITQTLTKISTYNGYSLVQRSLPPLWACPPEALSSGTGGAGGTTGSTPLPETASLSTSDCKSLANLRRPILKAQSQAQLDRARASTISTYCRNRSETVCLDNGGNQVSTYNCGYGYSVDAGMYPGAIGSGGAMAGAGGAAGSSSATQYSTTNTQVASVDEADYIKNDGNTIYVLSSDGLHIIDAWPAAETHEVARLTLPGSPRRLYLSDNRLVVYSRVNEATTYGAAGSSNPSDQGCTYGYGCRFSSEGGHTLIIVYDVTTPATPRELMRYELSGGYVDSRRIGSFIYTMVHDSGATQVSGLVYDLQASSYEEMQQKYLQNLARNAATIDATKDDMFLPWTSTTSPGGSPAYTTSCQYALTTQYAQGGSFVSINTFDLTTLDKPTRTILASNAGYVYASGASLYLAVDRTYEQSYAGSYMYSSYQPTDSFVHKFALNGADTRYVGSVTLPGHILNQFAMDESNGVLRVASTRGWVPAPSVVSYVTTFGDQSGKLVQLGQVGEIAPQEDIRAVRFDGDRGYVVTFKKTDPLFVFDLGNAAAPKLLGELQIPGFSTYMQRLDASHLLAIGFTADDQGDFAYFNGIQIQIFDVTDLANPKLAWRTVIGTRGSNSEALTNHLAFNYFAPKKMLAIPMTICEGGGNGSYGDKLTFAGLMAFDVSLDTGITEHGRMPFLDASTTVGASGNCNTWWSSSTSLVKRSIFMDDFVYGLSDAQLRVAGLSSMSSVLATLPLVSK